jgi:hypothetical protein
VIFGRLCSQLRYLAVWPWGLLWALRSAIHRSAAAAVQPDTGDHDLWWRFFSGFGGWADHT